MHTLFLSNIRRLERIKYIYFQSRRFNQKQQHQNQYHYHTTKRYGKGRTGCVYSDLT